jgi:hypothetical protein
MLVVVALGGRYCTLKSSIHVKIYSFILQTRYTMKIDSIICLIHFIIPEFSELWDFGVNNVILKFSFLSSFCIILGMNRYLLEGIVHNVFHSIYRRLPNVAS